MSDSVRPHRRQPLRLPHPRDSPGENTGVGCHFLLQCMKVKSESEVAQSCQTLSDPMDRSPPGSSVHGIFQARGLGCGAIAFSGLVHSLWAKFQPSLTTSAGPLVQCATCTPTYSSLSCFPLFHLLSLFSIKSGVMLHFMFDKESLGSQRVLYFPGPWPAVGERFSLGMSRGFHVLLAEVPTSAGQGCL